MLLRNTAMADFLIELLIKYRSLIITGFLLLLTTTLSAQKEAPLVTDRPDVTESAVVVPINSFQIETGFIYQKQKFDQNNISTENDNLILASTVFRYGINDKLELRFGGEYLSGKTTEGVINSDVQGLRGLFVGSKFQITNDKNRIGDLALLLELGLPFGNEKLRSDKIEPKFIIAAAKDIDESLIICINAGSEYDGDAGKNHAVYSASLGISLGDRIGAFLEYYGDAVNGSKPRHNFDFGFTYLQKKNIQIDASAGTILLSNETNWFGSIGFTVRLGN